MFWGALDQLSRWNAYERDGAQSGLAVANTWKQIIEDGRASECPVPCPSFYIETNDINCPQNPSTRTSRVVDSCDGCGSRERVHFSRSIVPAIFVEARIGYSCFSFLDDTPCGGHFCQVRGFSTGVVNPNWKLQWRDCLNVDHEFIPPGPIDEFVYNDFEAQWMCLLCSDNFCATVSIDGPILCTIA